MSVLSYWLRFWALASVVVPPLISVFHFSGAIAKAFPHFVLRLKFFSCQRLKLRKGLCGFGSTLLLVSIVIIFFPFTLRA